mmetsp:Transcript_42206/g.66080  ORF Transcript_42206/g.66080 Transcript_42206/m.66080 type:complete len:86 (-) Transcript_42206:902-1159(-)
MSVSNPADRFDLILVELQSSTQHEATNRWCSPTLSLSPDRACFKCLFASSYQYLMRRKTQAMPAVLYGRACLLDCRSGRIICQAD